MSVVLSFKVLLDIKQLQSICTDSHRKLNDLSMRVYNPFFLCYIGIAAVR